MTNISAESKVIASFTFVVVMMLGGWQSVGMLVAQVFHGGLAPELSRTAFSLLVYLAIGAATLGALLLARAGAEVAEAVWARHLGHATVLLGSLVLLAAALGLISSLASGGGVLPYQRF
jgi:hypothetical protein